MNEADVRWEVTRRYLADVGGHCPACRYDLKGAPGDRCPECGAAIRLRLVARSGAGDVLWWIGLLGTLMALLMTMRLMVPFFEEAVEALVSPQLVAMVRGGFRPASDLPKWGPLFMLTFALVAMLIWLGGMIGTQRRFGALKWWMRILTALIGVALPILVVAGLRLAVGG